MRKPLSILAFLLGMAASIAARADFSGVYAVENWSCPSSHCVSGAPDWIALSPPRLYEEGDPPTYSFVFNSAPAAGIVSFSWSYHDDWATPGMTFGYLLEGSLHPLFVSGDGGGAGSATFAVARGNSFGFAVRGFNDYGDPVAYVSDFVGPVPQMIPEPETHVVLLIGLALLGYEARRRRLIPRHS